MPALSTTPPPEGTYRFVLQHARFVAVPGRTHPVRLVGYEESHESIGVALPGQPMRHTVFARKRTTVERAVRDGWVDVTKPWEQYLLAQRPKASTPAQASVLAVLTEDWQDKASIVAASHITDTEWRTTIKLLEERGLVELNHGPRQRKAASNRSFRYRRGPRYADALVVAGG